MLLWGKAYHQFFLALLPVQWLVSANAFSFMKFQTKTIAKTVDVRNCSGSLSKGASYLTNVVICTPTKDESSADIELFIAENFPNDFKIRLSLSKCEDRKAFAGCENVLKFEWKDSCKKLNEKGQVFSTMSNSSEPNFACPIQPALYKVPKMMLDSNKLETWLNSLPGAKDFYWKVIVSFVREKKLYFCMEYITKIDTIRV